MPVTRYGVYLAYAPTIDLRAEGLGRHLALLLAAASRRDDVRFVVACPSWTRRSLLQLCESEGVPADSFDILSPAQQPALLRVYEQWQRRERAPSARIRWWTLYVRRSGRLVERWLSPWRKRLIATRSVVPLLLVGGAVGVVAVVMVPIAFTGNLLARVTRRGAAALQKIAIDGWLAAAGKGTERAARQLLAGRPPKDVPTVVSLYREMQEAEIEALHTMIESRADVLAWYSPTAFWPSVTSLKRPHLICVPDVVLSDFAASFSSIGGDRLLETFRQIEHVIARGRHFVTYSTHVKRETLVRRFGADPAAVDVVPHGAIRLEPLIAIDGFADAAAATESFCRTVIAGALRKAPSALRPGALGESTRYLFYASQFRPHKNIVNLLRACEYLLRHRYVGCKLVLTGNPQHAPEIADSIARLRLQEEVIFLHRLTAQELAACYRKATLAVNPSLFEGGLPFTFSEAVSVGTPVVMARIPVTLDAIGDAALRETMLFDPYDWKDIAYRIEWALANRDDLLARERDYFDRVLAPRSWDNVLDDYVNVLRRIAVEAPATAER